MASGYLKTISPAVFQPDLAVQGWTDLTHSLPSLNPSWINQAKKPMVMNISTIGLSPLETQDHRHQGPVLCNLLCTKLLLRL